MQRTFSIVIIAASLIVALYDFELTHGIATLAGLTAVWLGSRTRLAASPSRDSGGDQFVFELIGQISGLGAVIATFTYVGPREGIVALLASIFIAGAGVFDDTRRNRDWSQRA